MGSNFYFLTTDLSRRNTEYHSACGEKQKNIFNYFSFSVTFRVIPWLTFFFSLNPKSKIPNPQFK